MIWRVRIRAPRPLFSAQAILLPTIESPIAGEVVAAIGRSGISPIHLWRRVRLLALLTAVGALLTVLFLVDEGAPLLTIGPLRLVLGVLGTAVLVWLGTRTLMSAIHARAAWRSSSI